MSERPPHSSRARRSIWRRSTIGSNPSPSTRNSSSPISASLSPARRSMSRSTRVSETSFSVPGSTRSSDQLFWRITRGVARIVTRMPTSGSSVPLRTLNRLTIATSFCVQAKFTRPSASHSSETGSFGCSCVVISTPKHQEGLSARATIQATNSIPASSKSPAPRAVS